MVGAGTKEEQGKRLKRARERAGYKTATEGWKAAKMVGKSDVSKDTYLQHENGTRGLKAQAEAYSTTFGVPAAWLVWAHDPPDWADGPAKRATVQIVPRYLEARYRVQAGHWYEQDVDEPPKAPSMAVLPDPRFADWPQWLEEVVGDSVNLKIAAGRYAHVVDAIAMGYSARHGDWVVVERRRHQGGDRERTIKQLEVRKGRIELWPRSDNPKWNSPVVLNAGLRNDEETEIEIVGLVIGAYDGDF